MWENEERNGWDEEKEKGKDNKNEKKMENDTSWKKERKIKRKEKKRKTNVESEQEKWMGWREGKKSKKKLKPDRLERKIEVNVYFSIFPLYFLPLFSLSVWQFYPPVELIRNPLIVKEITNKLDVSFRESIKP